MKKQEIQIIMARIKHKNISQPSVLITAKHLVMKGNHLFFYNHWKKKPENVVFKVWLKKNYKTIKEAIKDVGIEIREY